MSRLRTALLLLLAATLHLPLLRAAEPETIWVEAESFKGYDADDEHAGTWKFDPQFADQMGSAYLLAHGLGTPVADVSRSIDVKAGGLFRVFVRTRDWVAPHGVGRFQLLVDGVPLKAEFGTTGGGAWVWQDGGTVTLPAGTVRLALHDLTGFDGRCDAIALRRGADAPQPPAGGRELQAFRNQALGWPATPPAETYDLVVVGAGVAGLCASTAAARDGLRVALVDMKPMLGGAAATGVKPAGGDYSKKGPYRATGRLVELFNRESSFAKTLAAETNITCFLSTLACGVRMQDGGMSPGGSRKDPDLHPASVRVAGVGGGVIDGVYVRDLVSGQERLLRAPLVVDATGDGAIGYLAGAEYRYGREAREEFGETLAPEKADRQVMGSTLYWQVATNRNAPAVSFPDCSAWAGYAIQEKNPKKLAKLGSWNFEAGFFSDQVGDFEAVRDHLLRTAYGTWSWIKNQSPDRDAFRTATLGHLRYLCGKRESRRLVGDIVLTEHDVAARPRGNTPPRTFTDGCVPLGWPIDLHTPREPAGFKEVAPEWQVGSKNVNTATSTNALVPYRCLYSATLANLFMAGRDISATHVAMGTTRIQKCGGMEGAVVGRAAAMCKALHCQPRELYASHWAAFAARLKTPPRGIEPAAVNPQP